MKKTLILLSAVLALSAASASAKRTIDLDTGDHGGSVRSGPVHIAKGETLHEDLVASGPVDVEGTLDGDLVAMGSSVKVEGTVLGDVASMGGPVEVSGMVKGDVASLGGGVTLKDGAQVLGDVSLMGGTLDRAPGAVVKGDVTHADMGVLKRFKGLVGDVHSWRHHPWRSDIHEDEPMTPMRRLLGLAAATAFLLGMGMLIVLLSIFLPKQVETVARAAERDFWRSIGLGTLVLILIGPALVLMAVSIIGIPLIPLAVLLVCGAFVMALASFSLLLGERVFTALEKPAPRALAGVASGYAVLAALFLAGKLVQVAGPAGGLLGGTFVLAALIILSCAVVVGFGAIWTTRMGSRSAEGV
ncbi:MAG: polymer-forming cytoskeletal protein [Elusimicrobia bacterium]|nr:polymer-forming cytoskeletal protein [Elusimicrobiota bacterium]